MITIPPTNSTLGFVSPVFFESSERIRERIVDCSKDELVELAFFYLGHLESIQGFMENKNQELEKILGYRDPIKFSG